jgi:hypothetical protein
MTDNQAIKQFVRNTLGCSCPEQVFEYIDCRKAVNIDDNIVLDYEINIGNRLLIFVAGVGGLDSLGSVLPKLVHGGLNKRDQRSFNRFRLVLLTAAPDDIEQPAEKIFSSLIADEKAHLHVINKDAFPANHK